jgi:hypothetical protein
MSVVSMKDGLILTKLSFRRQPMGRETDQEQRDRKDAELDAYRKDRMARLEGEASEEAVADGTEAVADGTEAVADGTEAGTEAVAETPAA